MINKIRSRTTGWLGNLNIMQKMAVGFSTVILFTIAIVGISIASSLQSNKQTDDIVNNMFSTYTDLQFLDQNFAEKKALAYEYLLTENIDRVNDFDALVDENGEVNEQLLSKYDNEEVRVFIEENTLWNESVQQNVFDEMLNGNKEAAISNLNNLQSQTDLLVDLYNESTTRYEDSIFNTSIDLANQQRTSLYFMISLTVFVIILSILIAWITAQSISRPVGLMRTRVNEFANADFSSEPFDVTTADEIADLATALNTTQANLINLTENILDSSEIIASNSNELTIAGREVQNGTDQITATMQELASGTEMQASSASDLSETMNNFVHTINETSKYGEDIQTESQAIASKAQDGNQLMGQSNDQMQIITDIVEQAVLQMENLNNETNEISNLIDIINGIAQQTNLLALNASIEAARAGEQGRGFAVVAEEVRTLAEEVASSVSEITRSVETVQDGSTKVARSLESVNKEVDVGTVQIQATDENLTEIMSAMDALREKNNQMAANLNHISENTVEINSQISEIASVSEESAAGVEETSASTEEINSSMDEITNKSEGLQDVANILDTLVNGIKIA